MNDLLPRRKALTMMAGMALSATGFITPSLALAQSERPERISSNELVNSGHRFFGTVSRDRPRALRGR